jgi:hypothetical protein
VATGQVIEIPDKKSPLTGYFGVIGMRAGVSYGVKVSKEGYELGAFPVMEPDKSRVIYRWESQGALAARTGPVLLRRRHALGLERQDLGHSSDRPMRTTALSATQTPNTTRLAPDQ